MRRRTPLVNYGSAEMRIAAGNTLLTYRAWINTGLRVPEFIESFLVGRSLPRLIESVRNCGRLRGDATMARTLPVSEVKTHLPQLLTGVEEREEEVVVTRKGHPAAVLVNFAEYEQLKATVEVLSDPELIRQIRASQRHFAAGGKGISFEQVFGEPLRPARKQRR
jgi:antitoxin YefM